MRALVCIVGGEHVKFKVQDKTRVLELFTKLRQTDMWRSQIKYFLSISFLWNDLILYKWHIIFEEYILALCNNLAEVPASAMDKVLHCS